jgi:hypothetical protein
LTRTSRARRALRQWSIAHPPLRGLADLDELLTDDDNRGQQLDGHNTYAITFPNGQVGQHALVKGAVFGVAEGDLLFALPALVIRNYLQGPFPDWRDLVAECRAVLGKGPFDSVDWKTYAETTDELPFTSPAGACDIVQRLDLRGVPCHRSAR